jgi:glycosyltransferase involved in cell wall biosynthesis
MPVTTQPEPANRTTVAAAARERAGHPALRILMVVESSAGGTGRHVLDLCDGLIARGCEVHLIYSTGRIDGLFIERLSALPRLRRTALRMRTGIHPSDFGVVRAVRRYLRDHGPFDAIHGHSSKGGAIARLAALGAGVPAFYTLHGLIMMDPGLAAWKRAFYLGIEFGLSLRTSGIIAVSPEEQRAAIRLGLGRSRVAMVPNGIGPARLAPRQEARAAIGVSDDAVVIGFVGRLVEQKAPEVLVRGFATALARAPKARLAIVGAGPLEEPLRELATALGVADRIHWLGERDARGVLAGFDAFALSSRKEGLPYVILEAMAAGLPVVATTSAGVEILVEPGVSGEVVPRDDAVAFGEALAGVASDADKRHRYGRAALARTSRFTIDAMVNGTLAAYAEARAGEAAPDAADESKELVAPA